MASKRRLLKWVLTPIVVLLFVLWFGFTTFFFNPLEDDYEYDVSTLIPRTVDFYFSKADLADDIDASLRLRVADDFQASERGQALAKLPAYQDLVGSFSIEDVQRELDASLEQVPIEVDPLALFGGRDVAVAGYFKSAERPETDWAAYGRANWVGKLGVALLGHPDLLDLEAQNMQVEEVEGSDAEFLAYKLSGGQLARPLFIRRVLDVIIVGTDEEMFAEIPELERTRGENSFGLSAKYDDHISTDDREGDELELYVDYRALSEMNGWTGRWPDTTSEFFTQAFLGRIFQSGSINEGIGTLSFGNYLGLRLHGTLSTELMTPVQKRLYRRRGADPDTILNDAARLVPADAGVFVYGHGDVGDLLREMLGSAEDALVSNLEDLVRTVWGYADCQPLIDDVETGLADRFAFCMRNNDYPDDGPSGPPHDDAIVPAWALILFVDNQEKVLELRDMVHKKQAEFGIQGREPGEGGVWWNKVLGGKLVYEYWSPFVPGTGHLSSVIDDIAGGTKIFIVGNNHKMLGHMLRTYFEGAAKNYPRLSENPSMSTQLRAGLASSDLVVYLNPRAMSDTWRAMAKGWAKDKVSIDWSVERPRIEKSVVEEKMPGATWGRLTPQEQEQLDMLVQPELDAFETDYRRQHGDAFYREYMDKIDAWEAMDVALVQLSLDQRTVDLSARVKFPLE